MSKNRNRRLVEADLAARGIRDAATLAVLTDTELANAIIEAGDANRPWHLRHGWATRIIDIRAKRIHKGLRNKAKADRVTPEMRAKFGTMLMKPDEFNAHCRRMREEAAKRLEQERCERLEFCGFTKAEILADVAALACEDSFYLSREWRVVRYKVITARGNKCECCGAGPAEGVAIHVDHVKPRSKFPELALDPKNLQILCEDCNLGKGAWDQTDWRKAG